MTTAAPIASDHSSRQVRTLRHIITPEYPPKPGGVSDYTAQVAEGLAQKGEEVHVWCPGTAGTSTPARDVHVHRVLGQLTAADLRKVGQELDRFPGPRRILVQYVPHGYGRRSMNVPFCTWLWRRAKQHGDTVEIMVHEAFLTFEGSWRQYGAAVIHRIMTVILLRASSRIWVSIPECGRRWKSYTFGRQVPFQWLPVPSNVRVSSDDTAIHLIRRRYAPQGGLLVGHFGTYGAPVVSVLEPILLKIALEIPDLPLLLMGMSSQEFRDRLIQKQPVLESRLHATGPLASDHLSHHIAACDLLIQPYPDGATTRRTSLMVGLSHGKSILTTTSEVTEPLWAESSSVGLTPSGDADAFVQLLQQLLRDPAERTRMSHAARTLYQERFDISHTVAALRLPDSERVPCAS